MTRMWRRFAEWADEHQWLRNSSVATALIVGTGLAVEKQNVLIGAVGFVAVIVVCWAVWPLLKRL